MNSSEIDRDVSSPHIVQGSENRLNNSLQQIAIDYFDSEEDNISEDSAAPLACRRSKRKKNTTGKFREVNKLNRMRGQRYFGFSTANSIFKQNTARNIREVGPACSSSTCSKSKLRHCQTFDCETRKNIFDSFWNMSWEAKSTFVRSMVSQMARKRVTVENSRKHITYVYRLPIAKNSLQVCKKMFLTTLCLKADMVEGWLNSHTKSSSANRSQSNYRLRAAERKHSLKEYLEKLDTVESHYCRKDTNKKYIEATFKTKTDVYNDYKTNCLNKNLEAVSIFTFSQMFEELNLALFMPRKDQCDICIGFKVKQVTQNDYSVHVSKKKTSQT